MDLKNNAIGIIFFVKNFTLLYKKTIWEVTQKYFPNFYYYLLKYKSNIFARYISFTICL